MGALSGGHLAVDFASGSVPALIPFMTDKFHLGYALSALLLLAATASSSLVQPLFGLWSDRRGALWLIPGGTLLAAIGVGGAAISPVYPLVLLRVFLGGLGVAAFHPEGAKFAAYASGRKRASGMAYFNIGGNAGYALGAFATGQLVVWLGLVGGLVAMVPVLLIALALLRLAPHFAALRPDTPTTAYRAATTAAARWRCSASSSGSAASPGSPCSPSCPSGSSRSDTPRPTATASSSSCSSPAPPGRCILGPVADRIGLRPTLVITQALVTPLILVFIYVGGIPGAVALELVGVCVVGTFGVTMVLSQLYLPRHVGMASGLSVGLAMGVGGVAAVILGAVADAIDLKTALTICALVPAFGVVACLRLPAPASPPSRTPTPAVAPLAD